LFLVVGWFPWRFADLQGFFFFGNLDPQAVSGYPVAWFPVSCVRYGVSNKRVRPFRGRDTASPRSPGAPPGGSPAPRLPGSLASGGQGDPAVPLDPFRGIPLVGRRQVAGMPRFRFWRFWRMSRRLPGGAMLPSSWPSFPLSPWRGEGWWQTCPPDETGHRL